MTKSLVPVSFAALAAIAALAALAVVGLSGCAADPGDPADSARAQSSIVAVIDGTMPTLSYSPARPLETDTYPRLPTLALQIHESASIAYLGISTVVKYQLTYQALSDASGVAAVTPIESTFNTPLPPLDPPLGFPAPPPPAPSVRTLRIDPNSPTRGLLPYTVYRLRVQLYNVANGPLGPQSDWFYAVTAGTSTSPSDTLKWGRVDMVLRALDQLGDAQDGLIGSGGTVDPDGTRFVSINHPSYHTGDELTGWCDWFYHYLGVMVTDGLDGQLAADPVADGGNLFWHTTMNPNNVPNGFRDPIDDGCGTERVDHDHTGRSNDLLYAGCQEHTTTEITLDTDDNRFYSNISGNIYYDPIKSLPQNQGIANYQAMDSHAGMFLAFDPNGDGSSTDSGTVGTVWSIEGNVSDTVRIMHRPADSTVINGFGKLTAAMFAP
jgi:hypothetical protein